MNASKYGIKKFGKISAKVKIPWFGAFVLKSIAMPDAGIQRKIH